MKKISAILGLAIMLFAGQSLMAQQEAVPVKEATPPTAVKVDVAGSEKKGATKAEFKFEEETYNFGQIEQGDIVDHTFHFQNVGTEPLMIENIKVTCGCTTPSYSKVAIEPGGNGEVQAKFNSTGKMGAQMKSLTIYYGADMPKIIYLKGEVKPKATKPVDNTSGQ